MKKRDLADMFPEPHRVLRGVQDAAPQFYRCPEGHKLPHRVVWGRCSPVECVDRDELGTRKYKSHDSEDATTPYKAEMAILPRGMEAAAMEKPHLLVDDAAHDEAYAEETLAQARQRGIRAAREAAGDFPTIPVLGAPDDKVPLQERIRKRFEQVAVYAAEVKIHDMLYGTPEKRSAAAEEILDRAGVPRRREPVPDYSGPVIVVGLSGQNPYEQQINQKEAINVAFRQVEGSRGEHPGRRPGFATGEGRRDPAPEGGAGNGNGDAEGRHDSAPGSDVARDGRGTGREAAEGQGEAVPGTRSTVLGGGFPWGVQVRVR